MLTALSAFTLWAVADAGVIVVLALSRWWWEGNVQNGAWRNSGMVANLSGRTRETTDLQTETLLLWSSARLSRVQLRTLNSPSSYKNWHSFIYMATYKLRQRNQPVLCWNTKLVKCFDRGIVTKNIIRELYVSIQVGFIYDECVYIHTHNHYYW